MAFRVPQYTGQQVQSTPLPGVQAPSSVPSGAAALGAGIAALGGSVYAVAAQEKAQDDQTAVFNAVAGGRQQADIGLEGWSAMNGPSALEAGPNVLADFDSWVSETRAGLTPDQQRGFDMQIQSVHEDVRSSIATRSADIRLDVATRGLANVVQTFTNSAALRAARGGIRMEDGQLASDAPPGSNGNATRGPAGMVGGDPEWEKIKSAIQAHGAAFAERLPVDQATWERNALAVARSDLHTARIKAMLTPKADVPVDYRAARAYFDTFKAEIDDQGADDRNAVQANVVRAYQAGETERAVNEIFAKHSSEPGTWGAHEKAGLADIAALPEAWRDDAASLYKSRVAAAQKQEDATRQATHNSLKDALAQGAPLTRVVQSFEFGTLDTDLQDKLIAYGNDVKAGKYVVTDPAEYDRLTDLALMEPEKFIALNMEAERGLSPADAKELAGRQAEMVKARDSDAALGSGFIITETVQNDAAHALYPGDGETAKNRRGEFKHDLNDAVIAWQQASGKKASPEDVQDIADAYTAKHLFVEPARGANIIGRLLDLTYERERVVADVMPPDVLDDAVFALVRRGLEVNADNLAAFWQQWQIDHAER